VREIGPDTMTDQITREMIQEFLNDRKVGPRGKLNFARAIRVMSFFGKRLRCLPEDWSEIDHLTLPLVKDGNVLTYSPDDLKRLLAASPDTFIPCLALAAFAGMRSAEIERIGWDISDSSHRMILTGSLTWKLGSPKRTAADHLDPRRAGPVALIHTPGLINRSGLAATASFTASSSKPPRTLGIQWKQNALRHTCISCVRCHRQNVPRVAYESGIPRRLSSSIICN